jgi:site-specific DNA-adenine methylase
MISKSIKPINLKPFISYYGGKYRMAPKYPSPIYDTIIEPFAGSAGYSIRYYWKNVILCDINPIIYSIWDYLIHVSSEEILRLPILGNDDCVDDFSIPQEAKWLIGFWLNTGTDHPCKRLSMWGMERVNVNKCMVWCRNVINRIAYQVNFIRHWKVYNISYKDIQFNEKMTWFIDPPYNNKPGEYYKFGRKQIDYIDLCNWCLNRRGQVIVCENYGANWLPFKEFGVFRNTKNTGSKEVIWVNDIKRVAIV